MPLYEKVAAAGASGRGGGGLSADAYFRLGLCVHDFLGKPLEAERHYRAALAAVSSDERSLAARVHANWGLALQQAGAAASDPAVLEHHQVAVALDPDCAECAFHAGNCALEQAHGLQQQQKHAAADALAEAVRLLQRALELGGEASFPSLAGNLAAINRSGRAAIPRIPLPPTPSAW
mmetsp:Transcript_19318/g.62860  ORF Transcript_19318/g.62860 Transcript_19318/m.62860 type:complete len:178 (+) Transcript_19318:333-866(+)